VTNKPNKTEVEIMLQMAESESRKRANRSAMSEEQRQDLQSNMIEMALKRYQTFNSELGDWEPRCRSVMRYTDYHHVDSSLTLSRRISATAKQAIAIHGRDHTDAALEHMVDAGFDYWVSLTVLRNLGAAPTIETDGRIFDRADSDHFSSNGRRQQGSNYQELTFGIDNDTYDLADLSEVNIDFHQTLTETQQMVWDFHIAGQTNAWIADFLDRSESTISEHLSNIKNKWATFIDAA